MGWMTGELGLDSQHEGSFFSCTASRLGLGPVMGTEQHGHELTTYVYLMPRVRPPQRSWVRFLALPDFLRILGLEWGPLSLMSTIEELLGRDSSGSCPEIL
jgi:hypothetical protein